MSDAAKDTVEQEADGARDTGPYREPSEEIRRRNRWTGIALLLAILLMMAIHTMARTFGW